MTDPWGPTDRIIALVEVALLDQPGSVTELVGRTGLGRSTIQRALAVLHGAGRAVYGYRDVEASGARPRVWQTVMSESEADLLDSLRTLGGRRTVLELAEDTGRLVPEVRASCEALVRRGVATSAGRWVRMYRAVAREEAA